MKRNRLPALIFGTAGLIIILFLCILPLYGQANVIKLKVVVEVANIRQNPDIGSPIIHQLIQGAIIEANQKQEEWYSVQMTLENEKTISGYVHESLVMEIERRAPEEDKRIPVEEEIEEEAGEEIPESEAVEEEPVQTVQSIPEKEFNQEQEFKRFGFSISGGFTYMVIGDLNRGAQGLTDFYGSVLGETTIESVTPLHWSYIFGGELSYYISPKMAVNFGVDYFYGKTESTIEYSDMGFEELFTSGPKARSIPIGLSFSYYPSTFLRLRIGFEYHLAKCEYYYRFEREDRWLEWRGNSSSSGIGFIGGISLEKNISSRLSLFLEAAGRYAQIENFEGTDNNIESAGGTSAEKGNLYIWQGHVNETESYPFVYIRERKPSEAGVSGAHLAIVDFSGFFIKVGIKVRF